MAESEANRKWSNLKVYFCFIRTLIFDVLNAQMPPAQITGNQHSIETPEFNCESESNRFPDDHKSFVFSVWFSEAPQAIPTSAFRTQTQNVNRIRNNYPTKSADKLPLTTVCRLFWSSSAYRKTAEYSIANQLVVAEIAWIGNKNANSQTHSSKWANNNNNTMMISSIDFIPIEYLFTNPLRICLGMRGANSFIIKSFLLFAIQNDTRMYSTECWICGFVAFDISTSESHRFTVRMCRIILAQSDALYTPFSIIIMIVMMVMMMMNPKSEQPLNETLKINRN